MYTLRQLLAELEGFDMDAVITAVPTNDVDFEDGNTLFCITNPVPLGDSKNWIFTERPTGSETEIVVEVNKND